MSMYFLQQSYFRRSLGEVRQWDIFRTPSSSFWEASWLRLRLASLLFVPSQPTKSENIVQDGKKAAAIMPGRFWIAPSSSPRKAIWLLSWPTSWVQQIIVKSSVNCFSWHIMGLSKFHDTLSMIIWTSVVISAKDTHRGDISLICCCHCPFSYFAFW